ncbi:flavin reductase [Microvirga roseola]|uniref:flavin reductase n=1 Tax=Microvirga roseola TaxID=2883126 RepID=UPI001E37EBB3|nr:flavin reductase [Microvirga roseola]
MLKTHTSPPSDAASGAPALDPGLFREGMSRVAGAVHIVTTQGSAGRAGLTATAVAPVTDSPASLLVCVNSAGRSAQVLLANKVFCVNTLSAPDLPLADIFAGRTDLHGQDRFSSGQWEDLLTGSPTLMTSLVSFDCRLTEARVVATHHVILGEIVAVRLGDRMPALVYQGRLYHEL